MEYQSEWVPRGMTMRAFCDRNNVPYKVMDNFARNIHKKIVEVEVTGRPAEGESDAPDAASSPGRDIKARELPVRVHFSALSSEQVCSSLSRIKKNGAKDEGRTNNQLCVRSQALQPERPGPLDEEVLRGGGV